MASVIALLKVLFRNVIMVPRQATLTVLAVPHITSMLLMEATAVALVATERTAYCLQTRS